MNTNGIKNNTIIHQPLTVIVAAWDRDRVTPGSKHYLGVTITNRGEQDAVVQVRLESPSELLQQWCTQSEQWLALSRDKSGELTFCIDVPGDASPQWLDYEVVVRPQGAYAEFYVPPTRCRLQILAPETIESTQDPTFVINPYTTPDRPVIVQSGAPVPIELTIENRSDRVDRFRLECTGLPADWYIQVEYPRPEGNLGLVQIPDSLGVNPGDRGTIRVLLQPPPFPLAGSYLPTFRLASENDPSLGLLGLVYLRVEPVYRLQAQLEPLQHEVHDRPAQFALQFANLGNTAREVQLNLKPLTQPGECVYQIPTDKVTIAPQATAQIPFQATPQRWWTRPWFGTGKRFSFRLDLTDVDRQPITPETFQGQLTWVARPWWQLLLVILAGLGILGTLAFLIWWNFLRPPIPPRVLEFAAEDSRYAEANEDMARVRWQIENPQQIQTLKLTGYSPEGDLLSGPLVYDFQDGQLPTSLRSFCTQQKTLLSCNQIRSDAFQPGKYIFELTLTPKGRRTVPISVKTTPVEIVAKPLPTVTTLQPKSLVYREAAPGQPNPAEAAFPVADAAGVRLDWITTMPNDIASLHLIGRDKEGKMVGDIWYEFSRAGKLPESLRSFCRIGKVLVCRNVPTGLNAPGEYRFELQAVGVDSQAKTAAIPEANNQKPISTEIIKIQAQAPQIVSFQINGREAPAKLLIPVSQVQLPMIQVSWRVQGSATTQVELSPSPGSVPPIGNVRFPLSPQGNTTIALQVKTATGQVLTRSVTLETYEPKSAEVEADSATDTRKTPSTQNNATVTPITAPTSSSPSSPTSSSPNSLNSTLFGNPAPTVDDQLSPSEQPPQFNRGG